MQHREPRLPGTYLLWATALATALAAVAVPADAANKKFVKKAPSTPTKPLAPPAPRSALLTLEDWQKAPIKPLAPGELDALVGRELAGAGVEPAPLTSDEQFLRRVTLDLTGELPLPADVTEFVADPTPDKRARLIERLLDSDEFARHWAQYWRDAIAARLVDRRFAALGVAFEEWMRGQLKSNVPWDRVARAMITAQGAVRYDQPSTNGAAFLLAAHRGTDGASERAADTSRVFLGIQIQCAQCHDHPSDQWKRVQFHELAAFYARLGERPVRDGKRLVGIELVSLARGEHEMPAKDDPKKSFLTNPLFLDGRTPGPGKADPDRRRALADYVVDGNNYWFAGAFVNRVWGCLMGQAFYEPVDDMGPQKEAVFPEVLTRLTGSFRASHYDVKGLYRDIMNSQAYQRQIRPVKSAAEHLHFAAAYPTRLPADALWQALVCVLGPLGPPDARLGLRPKGAPAGLQSQFREEFAFDPSAKPEEVEGSVTEALLLMNNPVVNERIKAKGSNLVARILSAYPDDDDAVTMLYLRTLARRPTADETHKARVYLARAPRRAESYEDLLWALINSTEFLTKR